MISLVAAFLAIFVLVNAALFVLLIRPMRRMALIADRMSVGDMDAPEFPTRGPKEIVSLIRSFNRMRKSLDKALHLLEP